MAQTERQSAIDYDYDFYDCCCQLDLDAVPQMVCLQARPLERDEEKEWYPRDESLFRK